MLWHKAIGAGGTGGVSTLISDTFTDTNGTAIASHTPDVQAVSGSYRTIVTYNIDSNIQIISNTARGTTNNLTTSSAVIETGQSDVIVSADVNRNGTGLNYGGTGLSFRCSGSTGYKVDLLRVSTPRVRLDRFDGVILAQPNFSWDNNTTYNLKVIASGSSIKVYVDDVLYIDVTDSTYTGTEHGISVLTDSGTNSFADNLLIEPA
jgi:hypothetical protein